MKGNPKSNSDYRHGRSHRFLRSGMWGAREMIEGGWMCWNPSPQEWQRPLRISSIF